MNLADDAYGLLKLLCCGVAGIGKARLGPNAMLLSRRHYKAFLTGRPAAQTRS